jgi:hypothetical protein
MIFQIIHSHTTETCPAQTTEASKRYSQWWQSFKKTQGVKVLSGMVAPLEHTFYIAVEADDYATLAKALGPLLSIGTGDVSPVLTLDQSFAFAEAGEFRASK